MCEIMSLLKQRFPVQAELARRVGVKPQAVQRWFSQGYVPADRALQVSEVSGIPVIDLLPRRTAKDNRTNSPPCPNCDTGRPTARKRRS